MGVSSFNHDATDPKKDSYGSYDNEVVAKAY